MDFARYLRALRVSWWIVLLLVVLGGVGGQVRNLRATPVYESTLTFYVQTLGTAATNNQLSDDQFAENRANSYALLLSSDRLANRVASSYEQRYGDTLDPGKLTKQITGSAQLNTVYVQATVTNTSKQRSLRIARLVAQQFPGLVSGLDNRGTQAPVVQLELTSGPTAHATPVSPRKKLNILVGLAIGLVVGVLIALLRELRNTSVSTGEDLDALFTAGAIGFIPFESSAKQAPLVVGEHARGGRAEALRQVRTNITFFDVDSPPKVILVTSSLASEGKSSTATNLGLIFSETHSKVLIVEADLRRPRVTEYLGLDATVGLTNVLVRQVELEDVVQPWSDYFNVLPSGALPPNPSELLGSRALSGLVAKLRSEYDVIIIDTPPLLPVTDAAVLASVADGVVMVVRHGKTKRAQIKAAVQSLEAVDAKLIGFVLNMVPQRSILAYGSDYHYEETPQGRRRLRLFGRRHRARVVPPLEPGPDLADFAARPPSPIWVDDEVFEPGERPDESVRRGEAHPRSRRGRDARRRTDGSDDPNVAPALRTR